MAILLKRPEDENTQKTNASLVQAPLSQGPASPAAPTPSQYTKATGGSNAGMAMKRVLGANKGDTAQAQKNALAANTANYVGGQQADISKQGEQATLGGQQALANTAATSEADIIGAGQGNANSMGLVGAGLAQRVGPDATTGYSANTGNLNKKAGLLDQINYSRKGGDTLNASNLTGALDKVKSLSDMENYKISATNDANRLALENEKRRIRDSIGNKQQSIIDTGNYAKDAANTKYQSSIEQMIERVKNNMGAQGIDTSQADFQNSDKGQQYAALLRGMSDKLGNKANAGEQWGSYVDPNQAAQYDRYAQLIGGAGVNRSGGIYEGGIDEASLQNPLADIINTYNARRNAPAAQNAAPNGAPVAAPQASPDFGFKGEMRGNRQPAPVFAPPVAPEPADWYTPDIAPELGGGYAPEPFDGPPVPMPSELGSYGGNRGGGNGPAYSGPSEKEKRDARTKN